MRRSCTIIGCDKPRAGLGYCRHHYDAFREHGSPHICKVIHAPLEIRFWSHVEKTDTCWMWRSITNNVGYGLIREAKTRKMLSTHRVSWRLAYGEVPAGMNVLHKCDNPPCVRPDHLFLGTHADNFADAIRKGRLFVAHDGRFMSKEKYFGLER